MNHNWERRWHPLLDEWVILSATTADRPWSGNKLNFEKTVFPEFDKDCYLCPGVKRASGEINPIYAKPFVFDNDFPSLALNAPEAPENDSFYKHEAAKGVCRVVCFSPKHNTTLAEMELNGIEDIIRIWKEEYQNLAANPVIKNILIFENKGKATGTSNPHPHGQIYATTFVPKILNQELFTQSEYKKKNNTQLLLDIAKHELKENKRIICLNKHFVAFIPWFARFAFETYIVPLRHVSRITDLTDEESNSFAEIFHKVIIKFDNLYNISFPNITMLHNAPTDNNPLNNDFVFHVEFYPPMRSQDTLKYLAGFESGGGNIINPVMPEVAAKKLKAANEIHYKLR